MGAAQQPVDLDHLGRYTGGDQAVNAEILRLFENTCHEMLGELERAVGEGTVDTVPAPVRSWRELTHTLKGAARGIGAFALAEAAEKAERIGPDNPTAALEAVNRIKVKSQAVCAFIDEILGGEG